MHLHSKN